MGSHVHEVQNSLHRSLHIFEETRGTKAAIAFLHQELSRLTAVHQIRQQRLADAEVARHEGRLEASLDTATAALQFYAGEDNYRHINGRSPAIEQDLGRTARRALAAIKLHADDQYYDAVLKMEAANDG